MIALLAASLLLQSAEAPEATWNCEDPIAQQEMNSCAARDFEAADARLNAQWKETAAAMKARDASFAATGSGRSDKRGGSFQSLLDAQRAWLTYRDAHCRVAGYAVRGGSMEPLVVAMCRTQLTGMRTEELRALTETPG